MLATGFRAVVEPIVDNPVAARYIPGVVGRCPLVPAEAVLEGVESRLLSIVVVSAEALMIRVGRRIDHATAIDLVPPEVVAVVVSVATNIPIAIADHDDLLRDLSVNPEELPVSAHQPAARISNVLDK